jgi:DMSO/TMAO reductase YedYZ molybdopterin-dependent catalytic subunit
MDSPAKRDAAITRRDMLRISAQTGGAVLLSGFDKSFGLQLPLDKESPFHGGKLLENVDFQDEFGAGMQGILGEELDGRMVVDLSELTLETLVTPTDKFYIRTCASKLLKRDQPWTIRVPGSAKSPGSLSFDAIKKKARPCGVHLMECAGNARIVGFGLMSVADWSGVPFAEILDIIGPKPAGKRILVSGFDTYATVSKTSIPSASWVFTVEQLTSAKAFLATGMNNQPLTVNHGSPVRLIVPGWYGCTCIKWLDEIAFVDEDIEATDQMKEFATRTNQGSVFLRAKEYLPALIDTAAMPVRIEKWQFSGKLKYRVVGILWGGNQQISDLLIQFNPDEDFVPVSDLRLSNQQPWCLWSHTWLPKQPGTYKIRLKVKDSAVRTRRLDSGFYVRSVEITEI